MALDELAGGGKGGTVVEEAGAGEGDVGLEEGHWAAVGEGLGVIEVAAGEVVGGVVEESGAGDEGAGEELQGAGLAQAVEQYLK